MKKIFAVLMTIIYAMTVLSACSVEEFVEDFREKEEAPAEDDIEKEPVDVTAKDKYAIVTQKAGDPYYDLVAQAFKSVCNEADKECVICAPEKGLSSEQISIVKDHTPVVLPAGFITKCRHEIGFSGTCFSIYSNI